MKQPSKKLSSYIVGVTLVSQLGCATIVSDSLHPVRVDSTISGTTVTISDEKGRVINKVETPTLVKLSSGHNWNSSSYSFLFEKQGYKSVVENLQSEINPWYFGNFFFGGILGFLLIDPISGAMWKLDDQVYGSMPKNPELEVANQVKTDSYFNPTPFQNIPNTSETTKSLMLIKNLHEKKLISELDYQLKKKELLDNIR